MPKKKKSSKKSSPHSTSDPVKENGSHSGDVLTSPKPHIAADLSVNESHESNQLDITADSNVSADFDEKQGHDTSSDVHGKKTKKRFSFGKRKRPASFQSSTLDRKDKSSGGEKVKRAHSNVEDLTVLNKASSRQELSRQKASKQLSASLSNFDTSSMVANPDMDDWRMSGLLETVPKSNSMYSLHNTSSGSRHTLPTVEDCSELNGVISDERVKSPTSLSSSQSGTASHPHMPVDVKVTITPSDSDLKIESNSNSTISSKKASPALSQDETFVEAGTDFEYAADVHGSSKSSVTSGKQETEVDGVCENDGAPDAIKEGKPCTSDQSATPIEENKDDVIIIRELSDMVDEMHMDLPADVVPADWLVLNFAKNQWVFVSYTKVDGEVTELFDRSVDSVEL